MSKPSAAMAAVKIGDRFGRFTVVGHSTRKHHLQCRCDCGHIVSVLLYNLIHGYSSQCIICARQPKRDLTGQRFGDWTVLTYAGRSTWNCRCKCGHTAVRPGSVVKRGGACQQCASQVAQAGRIDRERLAIIKASLAAGVRAASLARVLGISNERVRQLVAIYLQDPCSEAQADGANE